MSQQEFLLLPNYYLRHINEREQCLPNVVEKIRKKLLFRRINGIFV